MCLYASLGNEAGHEDSFMTAWLNNDLFIQKALGKLYRKMFYPLLEQLI